MHSSTYGFCELGWLGSWTAARAHRGRWGGGGSCRAIQRCSLICLLYSELGSLSGLFFKLMWNQVFIPCLVLGNKSSVPLTLTPAFIYSSCEYLLSTCYVPETFVRARDTQQVNRTDQNALLSGDWQKKRGSWENFLGGGNMLYLGKSLGYGGICVCKNLLNDTLEIYAVTLCKRCHQKYKRIAHKYWILVVDMHSECLGVKGTNVCNLLWSETKNKMACGWMKRKIEWWLDIC